MGAQIGLEHPGVVLQEEFIEPLEVSVYKVHKGTGISQTALGEIVKGKRGITAVNGLKLAKFFGMSDDFFVRLQTQYDIDKAKMDKKIEIGKIIPLIPKKTQPLDDEILEA